MSIPVALVVLGEIAMMLFVVWCFKNERKLIAFEDRVIARIRGAFRARRMKRERLRAKKLRTEAVYTPVKPSGKRHVSGYEAA